MLDLDESDVSSALPGTPIKCEVTRNKILKKVRELCGWNKNSFPGSQPVSLCREYLPLLFRNEYVVCEKSDGVRSLLLAASGSIFLIGRLEEVHQIMMKLPVRGNMAESQQLTLLDGEVVMDKSYENDGIQYRFLCYDGIYIQRQSLIGYNLLERLSVVYTDVILPLKMARAPCSQLEIYLKDFFDISHISYIEEYSKILPHISDGLIFTPVKLPYTPGTCKTLLKWKPPHLNTVDFSIDVLYDAKKCPRIIQLFVVEYGTRIFYNEFLAPYGKVYNAILKLALTEQVTQMIVECSWITDDRVWTFIPNVKGNNTTGGKLDYDYDNGIWVQGGWYAERIREDKKLPNNISVVESVKSSIEDDITFEILVKEVEVFKKNGRIPLYNKCILPNNYSIH